MKKRLAKIIGCVLTLCLLCSGLIGCGGCGGSDWGGTNMNQLGTGNVVGGFVGQNSSYVYFINGKGDSTADNEFGAPVKGALMAAKKDDLSNAEVVVPKIFASTDYNAGVYIYGEYVYYGTPNTDKNSDGEIANNELVFFKTKLDGTDSKELFNAGVISTEYRVVENAGKVYIVYYDANETAIVSYDVSSGNKTVVAKTDATAPGVNATTLSAYKFLDAESVKKGYAVAYTLSVYSEEYYEEKASQDGYQRAQENYNMLYAFKAGDAQGTLIADGAEDEMAYQIVTAKNSSVFYLGIDPNNKEDFCASVLGGETKKGLDGDVVTDGAIIKSLDEVYTLSNGKVYLSTAYKADASQKQVVALASGAHELLDVIGGYVYYHSDAGYVARIELNNEDAEEQVVSDGTISHDWYPVTFMTVGDKDYMFYLDTSAEGASYVEYVDINGQVKEEKDNDGKTEKWYLDGQKVLGKMTTADKAVVIESKINALPNGFAGGKIVLEQVEGALVNQDIKEIREFINAPGSAKDSVNQDVMKLFGQYEKAVEMANVYNKLAKMRGYDFLSDAEQAEVKAVYNQVKGQIEDFRASEDYANVVAFIDGNYLNLYQDAVEKLA